MLLFVLGKESILHAIRPLSQIQEKNENMRLSTQIHKETSSFKSQAQENTRSYTQLEEKVTIPLLQIQEEISRPVSQILEASVCPVSQIQAEAMNPVSQIQEESTQPVFQTQEEAMRPGTTKRRQYYYKRVAPCLTNKKKAVHSSGSFLSDEVQTISLDETTSSLNSLSLSSKKSEENCDISYENAKLKKEVIDLIIPVDDAAEEEGIMESREEPLAEIARILGLKLRDKFPNLNYYNTEDDTVLR